MPRVYGLTCLLAGIAGFIMFGASFRNAITCNVIETDVPVWRVKPLLDERRCAVDFYYGRAAYAGSIADVPCVDAMSIAVCYPLERPSRYGASTDATSFTVIDYTRDVQMVRYVGLALTVPLWVILAANAVACACTCAWFVPGHGEEGVHHDTAVESPSDGDGSDANEWASRAEAEAVVVTPEVDVGTQSLQCGDAHEHRTQPREPNIQTS